MDNIVDSLNSAYQDFISAAATTLESRENAGGQKTPATDAALENFKQRWELFRVACDQAEEFVESVKQRIGSECLVDEATGSVAAKPGQPAPGGLPPISAVRLEQMSKAVRWLVIELQQESGLEVLRRIPTLLLLSMLDLPTMLLNREEAFNHSAVLLTLNTKDH